MTEGQDLEVARLEQEFHQRVGRVVRSWARLESQLWLFTGELLGVDQFRARIVFESMPNFRGRKEFLFRLAATYLDSSLTSEMRALIRRLDGLSRRRNLVAHAYFSIGARGNTHLVFNDRFNDEDGLVFSEAFISNSELDAMAVAIDALNAELVHFLVRMHGKVHASARTHREAPRDPSR